jgi:hypothetical protein
MIGATGFEPATFRPPAECATRLRHAPGDHARYAISATPSGSSVVYMLRAQGRVVRSPDPSVQNTFGDWYFNERRIEPEVLIGDKQLPPDAEPLARMSPLEVMGPPPPNPFTGEPGKPEPDFTVAVR